jgi:hypothetical protein
MNFRLYRSDEGLGASDVERRRESLDEDAPLL